MVTPLSFSFYLGVYARVCIFVLVWISTQVEQLGLKLKAGALVNVVAVPTSERTRLQAEGLGIPLATLDDLGAKMLDVAIDGADSVSD